MEQGGSYYDFQYNSRTVKPTILHFQVVDFHKAVFISFHAQNVCPFCHEFHNHVF